MGTSILEGWRPGEVCDPFASITGHTHVEARESSPGGDPYQDRVITGVFDYQERGVSHEQGWYPPSGTRL